MTYTFHHYIKEFEAKVLEVLREKPGQFISHEELACRISPRGLGFYRAMQELVGSGRVEQNTYGYKAKI